LHRLTARPTDYHRPAWYAAEQDAIRRRCKYVFLDTMDYQAPEFYQNLGYRIAGQIEDWDSHGHTKYWMVRTL
jgi:hypothetical protein